MSDAEDQEQVNASLEEVGVEDLEDEEGGGLDAKKILLFIVAPILVLLGVGGGLYFSGFLDSFLKAEEKVEEKVEEEAEKEPEGLYFLEIPDLTVNLNTTSSQPRYLRLKIQLEFSSVEEMRKVEAAMPRVIDQFQTYLRELRVRDLRGSAGIYRLQIELLSRVNAAAYPAEVKDVLFQEILIQ